MILRKHPDIDIDVLFKKIEDKSKRKDIIDERLLIDNLENEIVKYLK